MFSAFKTYLTVAAFHIEFYREIINTNAYIYALGQIGCAARNIGCPECLEY